MILISFKGVGGGGYSRDRDVNMNIKFPHDAPKLILKDTICLLIMMIFQLVHTWKKLVSEFSQQELNL